MFTSSSSKLGIKSIEGCTIYYVYNSQIILTLQNSFLLFGEMIEPTKTITNLQEKKYDKFFV